MQQKEVCLKRWFRFQFFCFLDADARTLLMTSLSLSLSLIATLNKYCKSELIILVSIHPGVYLLTYIPPELTHIYLMIKYCKIICRRWSLLPYLVTSGSSFEGFLEQKRSRVDLEFWVKFHDILLDEVGRGLFWLMTSYDSIADHLIKVFV